MGVPERVNKLGVPGVYVTIIPGGKSVTITGPPTL